MAAQKRTASAIPLNRASFPETAKKNLLPVRIREARSTDARRIAEYNRCLAEETERKQLDAPTVLAGVQALLDAPAHGRYYVADIDDELVGQLLLTYEWSDWRNGRFWWIQSVYVAPSHRRQGIFSALYGHVKTLANQDPSVCGLRLYVEAHNAGALETYRALGMSPTGYHVLEIELD